MRRRAILTLSAIGLLLSAGRAAAGPPEDAAEAFTRGRALLAEADFAGALSAFRLAAKTDTTNTSYGQEYAMLRQVVRMRMECRKQRDTDKWIKMADALRAFYHDHALYTEALPLDQERHRRRRSGDSAVLLAETQLALGMRSETVELLGNLKPDEASVRGGVLHGLALARMGRLDEARVRAKGGIPGGHADSQAWFEFAGLRSLTGDATGALAALSRSFELTPPSRLDALKARARKCADFRAIATMPGIEAAMKTESKIKESKCSQGSDCGKCPSRAKCSTTK